MMLPEGLRARVAELFPGTEVTRITAMSDDETAGDALKSLGYGHPLRVELSDGRSVVIHTLRADDFGHDRRADRVGNLVLAYDTFGQVAHHARALDVGLVRADGTLASLAGAGEPYLITEWIDGTLYADDLRRIQATGGTPKDLERAEALARVLLEIHAHPGSHAGAYTRAIRDLLGHGEGIFGLCDSYTGDVVAPARLRAIEDACLGWRWKLRDQTKRLRRTHGDFHPFNIVFDARDQPHLLDASRGSEGDPADDVACLAINYVFFATPRPGGRAAAVGDTGARSLWDRFWATYLAGDAVGVCAAVAPFFAWRALVLANPKWYPQLSSYDRERILVFAERALSTPRFDPGAGWPP